VIAMTGENDHSAAVLHQSLRTLCVRACVVQVDGRPVPNIPIAGLTNDSRKVKSGSCFVAVKGQVVDGHDFLQQAIASGASAFVVDASCNIESTDSTAVVRVRDTREAVARLAAAYYGVHRGGPNELRLVGVTGTNGKSTIAWLVREILKSAGHKCALLGTIEYDLGGAPKPSNLTTPDPIQLCEMLASAYHAGARFGALEVSSHALEQRRCDGLTFEAAAFTNLSGDHLDYHESMDDYFAAKVRLFSLCDERSTAIINMDDEHGRRLISMIEAGRVSMEGATGSLLPVPARADKPSMALQRDPYARINAYCLSYGVDAEDAQAREIGRAHV